ncbi:DUF58 domain-containing protein [Agromyces sp. MMS24-JH15]|uniref:DUF58 domain-containing protein n=1 Tax=Agromyces sp. MMS24-JH15 TaxID=3243765 RepID=UPI00374A3C26
MPHPRAVRVGASPRLTGRGATLLAVGVVLLGVTLWFDLRDVMLLAFVAIAVPLVALGFVVVRVPRLLVHRTFAPAVASAGSRAEVRIVVRNRSVRAFDGAAWHDGVPAPMRAPAESVLPALGAYEAAMPRGDDRATLTYRLQTPRRGVFPIGPLVVASTDPFGLARLSRQVGTSHELVVTPRVVPLDPTSGSVAAIDGALHGLQRRSHPNSDELIAREYRYGDPMRRVNWPATARRGELMVRDEEQRADPEARILLDTLEGRAVRDDDAMQAGFELAVELAASIGVHLLGRGFRLRCDTVADPARGFAGPQSDDGYRMPGGDRVLLEDLARLDPTASRRVDVAAAAARAGREAPSPGYAILVDPDAADVQQLVALRTTFSPAVAFVLDSVRPQLVRVLEDADWRVVRLRWSGDVQAAWASTGGVGRVRVSGAEG